MIRRRASLEPAVRALGGFLRGANYADDVMKLIGDSVVDQRQIVRQITATALPAELAGDRNVLIELLLLGRPTPVAAARALLGEHLDTLLEAEVLTVENATLHADRYMFAVMSGRPFVVSRLRHDRSEAGSVAVFLGRDSGELTELGRRTPGRDVLDLGCGGGVVGISLAVADPSRRVVGADLCGEAVAAAWFNAVLNAVAYSAFQGDLYAPVGERRFDLILADPPAVPVPDELSSPVYGNGGTSGDRLMRRIVQEAAPVLRPGGRLLAMTELQGPPGPHPFLAWLERWTEAVPGRRAHLSIRGCRRLPATYHSALGANLHFLPGAEHIDPVAATPIFAEFATSNHLKFGHWVHLRVQVDRPGPSEFQVTSTFTRARPSSRPLLRVSSAELEKRFQAFYGHSWRMFGPVAKALITRADGAHTLDALTRQIPQSSPAHLLDLADSFCQLGVLALDTSTSRSSPP